VETAWIQDLRLWLGEDISFDILVDSVSDQANWHWRIRKTDPNQFVILCCCWVLEKST
jgi:hypothetical protein